MSDINCIQVHGQLANVYSSFSKILAELPTFGHFEDWPKWMRALGNQLAQSDFESPTTSPTVSYVLNDDTFHISFVHAVSFGSTFHLKDRLESNQIPVVLVLIMRLADQTAELQIPTLAASLASMGMEAYDALPNAPEVLARHLLLSIPKELHPYIAVGLHNGAYMSIKSWAKLGDIEL